MLILDNEGERLYAKYYKSPHDESPNELVSSTKLQKIFEKKLFTKTNKLNGDIILFDNYIVVYTQISDVIIYLIGGLDENELVLSQTLDGFKEALNKILEFQVDKKSIQENYDKVVIAADETIDDGIILETEPSIIVDRTSDTPTSEQTLKNIDLMSEKGLMSAFNFARGKIAERLQQGL